MLMVMDIVCYSSRWNDCDDTDPTRWEECGMFIIETVDAECITCPGPNSIDVDSTGQPHIARRLWRCLVSIPRYTRRIGQIMNL